MPAKKTRRRPRRKRGKRTRYCKCKTCKCCKKMRGGAKIFGYEFNPLRWGKKDETIPTESVEDAGKVDPTTTPPDQSPTPTPEDSPTPTPEDSPTPNVNCDDCNDAVRDGRCTLDADVAATGAGNKLTQQVTDAFQGATDAVNKTGKDLQNQLSSGLLGAATATAPEPEPLPESTGPQEGAGKRRRRRRRKTKRKKSVFRKKRTKRRRKTRRRRRRK